MIGCKRRSCGRLRPKPGEASSSSYMSNMCFLVHVLFLARPRTKDCLSMFSTDFLVLFSFLSLFMSPSGAVCNQQDQDSLLSISRNISSSSAPPLNWSSSTDCCFWEGIGCDAFNDRVARISLPFRGLSGSLAPSLLNLSHLSYLNLSHNRLSGDLPTGLFSGLSQLQVLDLSYNRFTGELPWESAQANDNRRIFPIHIIDLSSNLFKGVIQANSDYLKGALNLTILNLSNNSFTGPIPSFVCRNSAKISILDLSDNDFNGAIPSGLGRCSGINVLRAGFNDLSGPIPGDIFDLLELQELYLPVNRLSGEISDSITRLTKLTILELYSNQLNGPIPKDIGNLSKLESLQLHVNNLTGTLPESLAKCTNLVKLNLRVNSLNGEIAEYDFSPLQRLSILDLGNNRFTGDLPGKLYSCKSLTAVRLASNRLTGQISSRILALQSLSFISLSTNNLTNITGALSILQSFKKLTTLIMAKNFYHETVPRDENLIASDGFPKIQIFGIGGSQLNGEIPKWLIKLKSVEVMDLSQNRLQGSIPGWLGTLPNLFYMDLSENRLSGEIPKELFQLRALRNQKDYDEIDRSYFELPVFVNPNNVTTNQQYNQLSSLPPAIYIRSNNLTGTIPTEIGQLKVLHVLELSHNKLSGSIPDQLSNLTNLERLDLSYNNLSGQIPLSFKGLHFLSFLNVAYNNLQGQVPTGGQFDTFTAKNFEGNPLLCGPITQRSCPGAPQSTLKTSSTEKPNIKLAIGLVLGVFFSTCLILYVLALWILSKRRILPGEDSNKIQMETMSSNTFSAVPESEKDISLVLLFRNNGNEVKDLTILDLLKATDNFNQANIIGCGGFGLVFKATLENGTKLAVKKLSGDFGMMEKEFKAEVEVLSRAKHENLVSLQCYCVHDGCRILIYSYMENGSLDYWLHENPEGPTHLDWPKRLNIARGTGYGLAYMHQICEPHIVHRDIKSSNILLDENFKAHVADFGLSRLILPYRTHVTTELVGTLGYIPPEYGQAWVATLRGDVYSFGVVMLELLTGKRPMEVFRPKMSRELVGWVQQMRREGKPESVFDPLLRGKGFEEQMLQVLDVACLCVNQNPLRRPNIQEVVDRLKSLGAENTAQNNREEQQRG